MTEDVEIPTETYLGLWSEMQRNDVWSLPAGEWNWIDWMQAGHGFRRSVPRSEEYQDPPIDCGLAGVTVRAGEKSHGFLWYCPRALKDGRNERIIVAIRDLKGMREARIKVTGP